MCHSLDHGAHDLSIIKCKLLWSKGSIKLPPVTAFCRSTIDIGH